VSNTSSRLCFAYGVIAVVALFATWSQNVHYFSDLTLDGVLAAFGAFVPELKVNPAARSITLDILAFLLAANVWMVYEARRLGIRWVWAYIVGAFLIAISVTFPLFLIARERRLMSIGPDRGTAALGTGDSVALGCLAIAVSALAVGVLV